MWPYIIGAAVVIWIVISAFMANPLVMTIIAGVIVIAFIIYGINKKERAIATPPEVDYNFVANATKFLGNYISLCANHTVTGHAYVTVQAREEFGFRCVIGLRVYEIDGVHANEALSVSKLWQKEMLNSLDTSYDAYREKETAFQKYMQEYIGEDQVHYIFFDVEDYQYNDPDVVLEFTSHLFVKQGKCEPTLQAIKRVLTGKYPNSKIEVNKNGVLIK